MNSSINSVSRAVALSFAALACMTGTALGQSFNVNFGPGGQISPMNSYGAGANSPGFWNTIDALVTSNPLQGLSGNTTSVVLTTPTGGSILGTDPCLMGEDAALMQGLVDPVAPTPYEFTGLTNGTYSVYCYCLATDNAIYTTDVDVTGSTQGVQTVGGLDWCTVLMHSSPATYSLHTVVVTNGTITITYDAGATQFESFNGIQIVEGGASGLSTFCDPNDPNSTGLPTWLSGTLGGSVGSGLHLESSQGPPGQFAYFLIGTASSEPGIMLPGSQGRLCLAVGGGNVIGRYNVGGSQFNSLGLFDANGDLQNQVGTSTVGSGFDVPITVPISGSPQIMTGETWYVQLWHREAGGMSNFSNGVSADF